MNRKAQINAKWEKEKQAVRATQVAFDLAEKVQRCIRMQAVSQDITPSDYVRQVLGLSVATKPKRLRLSVSLTPDDLSQLAQQFEIAPDNKVAIKQEAAQLLIKHAEALMEKNSPNTQST